MQWSIHFEIDKANKKMYNKKVKAKQKKTKQILKKSEVL